MSVDCGCLICGEALKYYDAEETATCFYCGSSASTRAICVNGHFVCDACHGRSACDVVERYCSADESADPVSMVLTLMENPALKMHGPEHHFLVPAVLLAAYCSRMGISGSEKADKIKQARERSEEVKGGFCGFQGACGAAVGTGIFFSIITNATPLSGAEWGMCNLATARSLQAMAVTGGPRCCKRVTLLAIKSAADFLREQMNIVLDSGGPFKCIFSDRNRECLRKECPFY